MVIHSSDDFKELFKNIRNSVVAMCLGNVIHLEIIFIIQVIIMMI